ncbi:MAG TPA: prepilin-type N-terminal cleavage/methylation domain-containing protein [Candidatus Rifleibacterium sp.]|nr:prepilin-type N-terminal cleavage/methylation domain-containing protein [Candidatus Rifleibacterium sp.]HPT46336.1 prepilin-type N-terminal cleavage/methylation domain-containing protein [Candidatus Rifleibacterium sp.]
MKTRTGMTLMEMSLTIMLASIVLSALFNLSDIQRNVIRRLQHNTSAIYLLESCKNQIKYEIDHGTAPADLSAESLAALVENQDWKIELLPQTEPGKVVVTLQNLKGGRFGVIYQMEVKTQ